VVKTDREQMDFSTRGLTIRTAMLEAGSQRPPARDRPIVIQWGHRRVQTTDVIAVPPHGIVRGEILKVSGNPEQAFDIKVEGWIQLATGERVSLLRTWNDSRYEAAVEYPFHSRDGLLRVWNVYLMRYSGGQVIEEKWTENAGMWVQEVSPTERLYHCSPGMANPPDFESFLFKISILPLAPVS
jgi:hypothetical protein